MFLCPRHLMMHVCKTFFFFLSYNLISGIVPMLASLFFKLYLSVNKGLGLLCQKLLQPRVGLEALQLPTCRSL